MPCSLAGVRADIAQSPATIDVEGPEMLSQSSVTTTMALALILAGQPLSVEGRDTDLGLRRNVQRAGESSVYFSVFDDVQIDIGDEGIVVLTGHVTARN